jgi:hypothetical protein
MGLPSFYRPIFCHRSEEEVQQAMPLASGAALYFKRIQYELFLFKIS